MPSHPLPTIVFLHGMESGPHGSKYHLLRELDPQILAPDCAGVHDLPARMAIVERELAGKQNLLLVGSSFGGLVAALYAGRHPQAVFGCVLCAPALFDDQVQELAALQQVPEKTVILHGTRDDIVDIAVSRRFAAKHGCRLVEVEDGHRLENSRPLLLELVRQVRGG